MHGVPLFAWKYFSLPALLNLRLEFTKEKRRFWKWFYIKVKLISRSKEFTYQKQNNLCSVISSCNYVSEQT